MSVFDWAVLLLFFAYTLWDGTQHNRKTQTIEDLLLAGRRMPWWAMGLSVMATQASAITFIGTTGQAYMEDMRFIQVYLGLPVAMVILCGTVVPIYHRLKAFTAYELLERRFGLRMRLATSFLFLVSRGASLGIAIAAPAYVLSLILGVSLSLTILIIGLSATIYTMFGGISGVIRTDMKQMALMLFGLVFCFIWMLVKLPISWGETLQLAGAASKLHTIDLSFDPAEKYNLWSGLIAGLFLMLSYFGTDQSQVQRYLTAKSLDDARASLMLSAALKIPMQFFILLLGAFLYVFYVFHDAPLLFVPDAQEQVNGEQQRQYELQQAARARAAFAYVQQPSDEGQRAAFQRADREIQALRVQELERRANLDHRKRDDTNYVFPYFMLTQLPQGVLGLIVAAILAAALSSIDSMLNSLATVSVVDWYRRFHHAARSPDHYLKASRWATAGWGVFATLSAILFGETESIVELVNKVGSYFYGAILGVFILIWVKRAHARSAFWGFVGGMLVVLVVGSAHHAAHSGALLFTFPLQDAPKGYEAVVEYLWLNPIGTSVVVMLGYVLGSPRRSKE